MKLKYYGKELPFELIEHSDGFVTLRVLYDETEEDFENLDEADLDGDEEWYLDENGQRLEPEALFAASPWSLESSDGEIKLLERFHRADGEIHFNTIDGYGGVTFEWLQRRPISE